MLIGGKSKDKLSTKENTISPLTKAKKYSKRILLIDEDPGLLKTIKNGLEQYDFVVAINSNPLQVLSSIQPKSYDLILLGVRMSPINGFELCKELKKRTKKFNVKFCFITSFKPYYNIFKEEYSEIGEKCFIFLPISIDDLLKILNEELQ